MLTTGENTQLPTFISPAPDSRALAYYASALDWTGRRMFPPWCLLPRVLIMLHQEPTEAILIAPKWPAQPWYTMLTRLATRMAIQLPDNPGMPSQGEHHHCTLHIWQAYAWKLSSQHRNFLMGWPSTSIWRGRSAPITELPIEVGLVQQVVQAETSPNHDHPG